MPEQTGLVTRSRSAASVRKTAAAIMLHAAFLVGLTAPAAAAPLNLQSLTRASRTPALPASCLNPDQGPPSSDVEPQLAVNPRNPKNVIATWWIGQENFRERAKAGGIAYSKDGGKTWKTSVIHGVDSCTGGPPSYRDGGHDTWLSFDARGKAYLVAFSFGPDSQTFWSLTSDDGGRTWSKPVEVLRRPPYIDKPSITADPTRPGVAYVPYVRLDDEAGSGGDAYLSRTTDGGRSWERPRLMYSPPAPRSSPAWSEILVAPDGTLIDVFVDLRLGGNVPGSDLPQTIRAMRSHDAGLTWSRPVMIGSGRASDFFLPPGGTLPMELVPYPMADIAPDGRIYVVWGDPSDEGIFTGIGGSRLYLSSSGDGGGTWSARRQVGSSGFAVWPSLGVSADGSVGVTYYDLSEDKPGDDEWTARVRFARSHDGGRTWEEQPLGGTFDLQSSPVAPQPCCAEGVPVGFLGDYHGVAGTPDGFAAAFPAAKPLAVQGRSDIFVARLRFPALGLTVAPKTAHAGRRTTFVFSVTAPGESGRRASLPDALVRFARQAARTNARGRVSFRVTFKRAGRHVATATKTGYRRARTTVRILNRGCSGRGGAGSRPGGGGGGGCRSGR